MLLSAQLVTLYVWRHMWVEFVVGSLPCSKRFFSGYSGFPPSSKTNASKFQFDQDQVDKEPVFGCATTKSLFHSFFLYLFVMFSICSPQSRPYSFGWPPDYWPSNQAIRPPQTIRTAPRSDYNRPSSDPITKSDHPTRSQTTSLDYSASNQHSIPNPFNWYRSGAFFMGWDKGGI